MVNLLGDIWFDSPTAARRASRTGAPCSRHPRAKLHLYGKAEPRRAARWAT